MFGSLQFTVLSEQGESILNFGSQIGMDKKFLLCVCVFCLFFRYQDLDILAVGGGYSAVDGRLDLE